MAHTTQASTDDSLKSFNSIYLNIAMYQKEIRSFTKKNVMQKLYTTWNNSNA